MVASLIRLGVAAAKAFKGTAKPSANATSKGGLVPKLIPVEGTKGQVRMVKPDAKAPIGSPERKAAVDIRVRQADQNAKAAAAHKAKRDQSGAAKDRRDRVARGDEGMTVREINNMLAKHKAELKDRTKNRK